MEYYVEVCGEQWLILRRGEVIRDDSSAQEVDALREQSEDFAVEAAAQEELAQLVSS